MSDNKTNNEYSVHAQSFFRFLLMHWRLWIVLLIIIGGFTFIGKQLYKMDYFSERLVQSVTKDVTIKQARHSPRTSLLVINPMDKTPFRLYEIDLGMNCHLKEDLDGKVLTDVTVELYKRNYNKSYYLKFPTIKSFACTNHNIHQSEPLKDIVEITTNDVIIHDKQTN